MKEFHAFIVGTDDFAKFNLNEIHDISVLIF